MTAFHLLLSLQCLSFGIGDWVNSTPSGNQMGDPGGGTMFHFTGGGNEVTGIDQWYFYKEHTIGKYHKGYFIINEKANKFKLFESEHLWKEELTKQNLIPKILTRWYNDNWVFYDNFIILLFLGIPLNILLVGFIIWAVYKSIKSEHLNIKKPYTRLLIFLMVLGLAMYILDLYPQSI